jgi:hypothetical protein
MQPTSPIQRGKTDTFFLTVLTSIPRLKGVVIEFTALNVKITYGGKVTKLKPPKERFFHVRNTANNTLLLGVARHKIPPQRGNNRGVSVRTLNDSQQLKPANVKYTYEV